MEIEVEIKISKSEMLICFLTHVPCTVFRVVKCYGQDERRILVQFGPDLDKWK